MTRSNNKETGWTKWSEKDIHNIKSRYLDGESVDSICIDYKCSNTTIRTLLIKNGISPSQKTLANPDQIKDLNLINIESAFWIKPNGEVGVLNPTIYFINDKEIFKRCTECESVKSLSKFSICSKHILNLHVLCRDCAVTRKRQWYLKNKEWIRAETRKRDKLPTSKKIRNERIKIAKQANPQIKLRSNLRSRIYNALKASNSKKSEHTIELIGCSLIFLKQYLESKFRKGMSWDNYGKFGWHVDHIKPCSLFDLTKSEQQSQCFHYSNLQPLWWRENLEKSDNY